MNWMDALTKVCKWRTVLAGRWLGTRASQDEEDMEREEEPEDRGIEDPGADEDDEDAGGPDTDGLDLD